MKMGWWWWCEDGSLKGGCHVEKRSGGGNQREGGAIRPADWSEDSGHSPQKTAEPPKIKIHSAPKLNTKIKKSTENYGCSRQENTADSLSPL
jgi:hypothetical protein